MQHQEAHMKKMTAAEAVEILSENDHAYFLPAVGEQICRALGVPVKPVEREEVTGGMGLSVPGKKNGEFVEGYASHRLASYIVRNLDQSFSNRMLGRGSAQRADAARIAQIKGVA
jgi:hypothetical protein